MAFQFKESYPTPKEVTKGKNTCEYIVLHHTWTNEGTIKWVIDWLYRRADYASCHFVVDVDGSAYKIWEPTDILWHAWVSNWKWKSDLNKYSIGIEFIWPISRLNWGFTEAQKVTGFWLISHLMAVYKIPKENVIRHKDIAPRRKNDIADSFWNKEFKTYKDYTNTLKPREWV